MGQGKIIGDSWSHRYRALYHEGFIGGTQHLELHSEGHWEPMHLHGRDGMWHACNYPPHRILDQMYHPSDLQEQPHVEQIAVVLWKMTKAWVRVIRASWSRNGYNWCTRWSYAKTLLAALPPAPQVGAESLHGPQNCAPALSAKLYPFQIQRGQIFSKSQTP